MLILCLPAHFLIRPCTRETIARHAFCTRAQYQLYMYVNIPARLCSTPVESSAKSRSHPSLFLPHSLVPSLLSVSVFVSISISHLLNHKGYTMSSKLLPSVFVPVDRIESSRLTAASPPPPPPPPSAAASSFHFNPSRASAGDIRSSPP
jgi:hypothetical protein